MQYSLSDRLTRFNKTTEVIVVQWGRRRVLVCLMHTSNDSNNIHTSQTNKQTNHGTIRSSLRWTTAQEREEQKQEQEQEQQKKWNVCQKQPSSFDGAEQFLPTRP